MDIVVFGVGYCFDNVFRSMSEMDNIIACLDNDECKQGSMVNEIQIYPVDEIKNINYDLVVLCSSHQEEMMVQLQMLGVDKCKICNLRSYYLNKGRHQSSDLGKAIDRNLDIEFLRNNNIGLNGLSDVELINYYYREGYSSGVLGAKYGCRENIIDVLNTFSKNDAGDVLEIGPFDNPCCTADGVKYFDIYDSERLKEEAKKRGRNNNNVPPVIDYVDACGDLSIIEEKFDVVFSSHNIEHQPNLIKHLMQIQRIIKPNGYYIVIVPDKRFTFDYFATLSTVSKVVDDYENDKMFSSLEDVLNMAYFRTHNNALEHWKGNHGLQYGIRKNTLEESAYVDIKGEKYFDDGVFDENKIHTLVKEYNDAIRQGVYIDAHCNRFTPKSFGYIMRILRNMGYIKLNLLCAHNTLYGRQEFCAILQNEV